MDRDSYNRINDTAKNNSNNSNLRSIYPAIVVSNNDPSDSMRIKAKISSLDKTINDNDNRLFCSPFESITNWNIPKVGETVYVILPDPSKPYSNRLWKGPIIPQQQYIENSPFPQALSTTDQAFVQPKKPISSIPEAKGSYPEKETQSFQGRDNSALYFSKKQATLKAGMYEDGNPERKNKTNTAYLKADLTDKDDESISTVSSIADYINLISYNGRNGSNFRPEEMTKEELVKFAKTSFSILRGEPVIELLQKIIKFITNHTHNYHNLPSEESELKKELLNFDFDQLKNTGVKTN